MKEESPIKTTRHKSVEKKQKRQDKQKVSMLKRQQEALEKVQSNVGDIIRIKMDQRDATKAQALLAVVIEMADNGTGGCRVATENGVLSQDPGMKQYFIPCDRYKVLDPDAVVPSKLKNIQAAVQGKTFNETQHPKITMKTAYQCEYGWTVFSRKNASVAKVCAVPAVAVLGMHSVATAVVCAMVVVPIRRTNLEEKDRYDVKTLKKRVNRLTIMMTLT